MTAGPTRRNRSVPTDALLPHLTYQNVAAAITWLTTAFGFREHYRYGPPNDPAGAQVAAGQGWIMLESAREGRPTPAQLGATTQYLSVVVPDVDAHYARAQAAGVTIFEEPNETAYGERQYGAVDLDGHRWLFTTHVHDRDPADWGATVARPDVGP